MASSSAAPGDDDDDDPPTPCMAWFGSKRNVARQLWLCTWKNLMLRMNRPVASTLELLCPLIVFVALSVLTPRNEVGLYTLNAVDP
jgi:hypothetical protein